MPPMSPQFEVRFARDGADLQSAQRLRHQVFVRELGAHIDNVDLKEADEFDQHADHLLLLDKAREEHDQTIGVYRIMTSAHAKATGRFSSAGEYDLELLLNSNRKLMELGRSCLHVDYRGGPAMLYLWQALAAHIASTKTEILFGVASFHGVDSNAHATALSYLHETHLAPEPLRVTAHIPAQFSQQEKIDRKVALRAIPPLIKAYLRLGGCIGNGAFVDHVFNTVDVCMILDMNAANPKQKALYERTAND